MFLLSECVSGFFFFVVEEVKCVLWVSVHRHFRGKFLTYTTSRLSARFPRKRSVTSRAERCDQSSGLVRAWHYQCDRDSIMNSHSMLVCLSDVDNPGIVSTSITRSNT